MSRRLVDLPTISTDDTSGRLVWVSQGKNYLITLERLFDYLTPAAIGLGNVDNTRDEDKPISRFVNTALQSKADKAHTHTAADIADFSSAVTQVVAEQVGATVGLVRCIKSDW